MNTPTWEQIKNLSDAQIVTEVKVDGRTVRVPVETVYINKPPEIIAEINRLHRELRDALESKGMEATLVHPAIDRLKEIDPTFPHAEYARLRVEAGLTKPGDTDGKAA